MEIVETDAFRSDILEVISTLTFPHFGFRGWKEDYTGYFPVWKLSYMTDEFVSLLARVYLWDIQMLLNLPESQEVIFFTKEFVRLAMKRLVEVLIIENRLQPLLDIFRELPCEEDFEKRNSRVYIDFHRKWYHSRSKRVKMVSLEQQFEDKDIDVPDSNLASMEEQFESESYVENFKAQLTERDKTILEMRMEGVTFEETAKRLGYKNHSGVIKRMQKIKLRYTEFEKENSR